LPRLRKCRALPSAATVALVAPAFAADGERVARGAEKLREAGLRVRQRDDLFAARGYLAGDDARRARELMEAVEDDAVDAIVCVRGGWGSHRVVPLLDAARVRAAAKPLVGFSDVTTLLLWQRRLAGLVGFHGPMLEREAGPEEAELEQLLRALRGEPLAPLRGEGLGGGRAEGLLVGGSLTLLAASLGTPWEVETRGAILLFEEPYALDRLLHHLRAAGKLDGLRGIGVGALTGCEDPKRPTPTARDVVEEMLRSLPVPRVIGLPFGHRSPNLTWPLGVHALLDGEGGELRILEAGVTRR
jgi:muramoyltetrapeptide carboxypeptidase